MPGYIHGRKSFSCAALALALVVGTTRTVARQDSRATDVRRALERAAVHLSKGSPSQASILLDAVERAEPENPWLWYYRGAVDAQLGRAYPALTSFDRALELLFIIEPQDTILESMVRAHRRSVQREVFGLSLRIGAAYDTNVTFLGGDAVAEGLIAGEEDGAFGSEFSMFFSPIKNESQALTVGFKAAHLWQFRVDEFDIQDYTAALRFEQDLSLRSTLSFQFEEQVVYLGNDPYLFSPAATLGWQYVWPASVTRIHPTEAVAFYRFESRDFREHVEPEFDRDGNSQTIGLAQGFRFRPVSGLDWYWEAHLGCQYENVRTQGTEFDRQVYRAHGGLAVPLVNPRDTDTYLIIPDRPLWLSFRADWELSCYRNDSLNDRWHRNRVDRIGTYRMMLSQVLRQDPDQGDVTLHVMLRWSDADSNLRAEDYTSPFTYDKFVFGLQIEWSW